MFTEKLLQRVANIKTLQDYCIQEVRTARSNGRRLDLAARHIEKYPLYYRLEHIKWADSLQYRHSVLCYFVGRVAPNQIAEST
jgi:hypothetical protein